MTRVLIVDDEADVVEFLADELREAGYATDSACDGLEAVLRTIDNPYAVVVMDIRMPRLDGIGALRIIKRLQPNLPVILFTGQAGQGDMAAGVRYGAYTCLLKPVATDKLLAAIRQVAPANH